MLCWHYYIYLPRIANYRWILYLTTPMCSHSNWWNLSRLQGKSLYFWEVHGSCSPTFVTRSWLSATLNEGIWWFWTRENQMVDTHRHTNTDTDCTAVHILVYSATCTIHVLVYLCTYTHTLMTELQGILSTIKKWSACVSHRGNHSTSSCEKPL